MNGAKGLTIIELLVALAISGIILTTAALYLKPMEAPLHSAVSLFEGCVQRTRTQAMATTSSYRLRPQGPGRIAAQFASTCAATTWVDDPAVSVDLPTGVRMSDTSWSVCFDSRGLPAASVTVALNHPQFGTRSVEVMLGGATRIVP